MIICTHFPEEKCVPIILIYFACVFSAENSCTGQPMYNAIIEYLFNNIMWHRFVHVLLESCGIIDPMLQEKWWGQFTNRKCCLLSQFGKVLRILLVSSVVDHKICVTFESLMNFKAKKEWYPVLLYYNVQLKKGHLNAIGVPYDHLFSNKSMPLIVYIFSKRC